MFVCLGFIVWFKLFKIIYTFIKTDVVLSEILINQIYPCFRKKQIQNKIYSKNNTPEFI